MIENPSSNELVVPGGQIKVVEHPALWEASYINQPDLDVGLRLDIRRDDGTIDLGWGRSIGWRDNPEIGWEIPDVQDLYQKAVTILSEFGREIPKPPKQFASVESLIQAVQEGALVPLDQQKPKEGDVILVIGKSNLRIPPRSNTTIYLGEASRTGPTPHAPTLSYFLRKARVEQPEENMDLSIYFTAGLGFRLDYQHFSPTEEHITKVYEWQVINIGKRQGNWAVFMDGHILAGSNNIAIYTSDKAFLKGIKTEISGYLLPEQSHPNMPRVGGAFS